MSMYSYINFDYKPQLTSFYNYLNGTNFKNINQEKLQELLDEARKYDKIINNEKKYFSRTNKLIKTINKIKSRALKINCDMKAESAILFVLLIDPNFEAFKIYGECNTIKEIKEKMNNYFGFFDKNLVKLEKMYIKKFLSKEQKKEIDEEIEKRVFK